MSRDGLVTVRLWGALGEEFGHEHRFAIATPMEAIAALDANYPNFRRAMIKYNRYYIRADEDFRDANAVNFPVSREVDIVPHVEGQGPLVPAIAAAMVTTFGITTTTATILTYVLLTGLMIGVSLLLTPKPKKNTNNREEKKESNAFSGTDNVVGQGIPVPLVYGHCFVGSVVISVGIETADQIVSPNTALPI